MFGGTPRPYRHGRVVVPRSPAAPPDDDELVDLATVPLWQSEILRSSLQEEGIEAREVLARFEGDGG